MRVWFIPYSFLDYKRLLGQHREIHALYSCIERGTDWGGWVKRFSNNKNYLYDVHERYLKESAIRKNLQDYKSADKTPAPVSLVTPDSELYTPTIDELKKDVTHLREKWESELYLFGVGREDLSILETELFGKCGLSLDECKIFNRISSEFLKNSKKELYSVPKPRLQDKVREYLLTNKDKKDRLFELLYSELGNNIIFTRS